MEATWSAAHWFLRYDICLQVQLPPHLLSEGAVLARVALDPDGSLTAEEQAAFLQKRVDLQGGDEGSCMVVDSRSYQSPFPRLM